jgi:hypothetical protein
MILLVATNQIMASMQLWKSFTNDFFKNQNFPIFLPHLKNKNQVSTKECSSHLYFLCYFCQNLHKNLKLHMDLYIQSSFSSFAWTCEFKCALQASMFVHWLEWKLHVHALPGAWVRAMFVHCLAPKLEWESSVSVCCRWCMVIGVINQEYNKTFHNFHNLHRTCKITFIIKLAQQPAWQPAQQPS